jgi:hypothetical protein
VVGLPLVTTRLGAEGLRLGATNAAVVEDNPTAFAAALVDLTLDRARWLATVAAGRDHLEAAFGEKAQEAAVTQLLALVDSESCDE